ncbi:hypothetical protein B0H12DRAFT_1069781 [Mycena haematopus]|nr:hypothetical protein B0H12DRAFT_1069781 [Mycena haematopus]
MKSFQNFIASALLFSASSLVNAVAVSSSAVGVAGSSIVIGPPTSTIAIGPTTSTIAIGPSISVGSTSILTSLPSSSAHPHHHDGGFIVTGIYTTCLTVTFDAPTATASASIGLPTESASIGFTPAFDAIVSSAVTISEATVHHRDVAVFTTCLAFLPSAHASATMSVIPTSVVSSFPTTVISSFQIPTTVVSSLQIPTSVVSSIQIPTSIVSFSEAPPTSVGVGSASAFPTLMTLEANNFSTLTLSWTFTYHITAIQITTDNY